jgi:alkylhydroperoxidase/carboxymuconolactone decarboxylase family protein YurZ
MDKALYDRGMTMRRKVLGDEYVDRAVANTDDFNRQFQELLTTYCWGAVWGDDAQRAIRDLAPGSRLLRVPGRGGLSPRGQAGFGG